MTDPALEKLRLKEAYTLAAALAGEIRTAVARGFQPTGVEKISESEIPLSQAMRLTVAELLVGDAATARIRAEMIAQKTEDNGYRFDHARRSIWLSNQLHQATNQLQPGDDKTRLVLFNRAARIAYKQEVAAWSAQRSVTYGYGLTTLETAAPLMTAAELQKHIVAYRDGTFGAPGSFVASLEVPLPAPAIAAADNMRRHWAF